MLWQDIVNDCLQWLPGCRNRARVLAQLCPKWQLIGFSGCQASGARFVATSKPKIRTVRNLRSAIRSTALPGDSPSIPTPTRSGRAHRFKGFGLVIKCVFGKLLGRACPDVIPKLSLRRLCVCGANAWRVCFLLTSSPFGAGHKVGY